MSNQTRQPSAFNDDGNAFPRMDVNRKDPAVDAVVSKLVPDNNPGTVITRRNKHLQAPDLALMQRIALETSSNITASDSLLQMLPDTELAMQILVSSILSPKDMVSTELNYAVEPGLFNSELAGPMLECLRTYFDGPYKMGDLLPKILQDTLFHTGSYAMVVLPENSIDDAINSPHRVTLESIRSEIDSVNGRMRTVGLLGNPPEETKDSVAAKDWLGLESLAQSFESFNRTRTEYNPAVAKLGAGNGSTGFESFLTITDNPNTIKMPRLQDKMRQDRVQDMLTSRGLSMEAKRETYFDQKSKQSKEGSLFRRRRYKHQPVVAMSPSATLKKSAVGHPLVMHMPSESVIPVHVPSNPEEHLGYFILLDEQGNPLMRATESDYYRNMGNNLATNGDATNALIAKTKTNSTGVADPNGQKREDVEEMSRIYADLVEVELTQRLRNGVYGENVQVAKPQEVYQIMLSRALAKMRTQLLYVPGEMMTYVAFDYNANGVGVSLIQKSKIIGGLRVMLSFANTMAAIKNSIGRTKMGIQLDPADDDPTQTVEFLVHEHSKLRQGAFPLGNSNPSDILNYFANASVELEVSGNTAYPETKVLMEDVQGGRIKPDTELEELLKKRHLMALGLSPETVDAGANAEFATTIMANNLLLTKRVLMYQRLFVSFLQDHVQKYTLSSGWLMDALRKVVEENKAKLNDDDKRTMDNGKDQADTNAETTDQSEERPLETHAEYGKRSVETADVEEGEEPELGTDALIMQFVEALRITLPAPDTSTLDNQMKAYDQYVESLDKVLGAYLDSEFLGSTEMGGLEEYIPATIKAVRAHYLRQWLRNNNVMSELDDLTTFAEDDSTAINLLEIHENHVEGIGKSLLTYLQALAASKKAIAAQVEEVKTDLSGGDATGGDVDGIGGDDLGGDGGDTGGTDDFGGDIGADTGTDADAATDLGGDDLELSADGTGDTDTADAEQSDDAAAGAEGAEEGAAEVTADAEDTKVDAKSADATDAPATEPAEAEAVVEDEPAEETKPAEPEAKPVEETKPAEPTPPVKDEVEEAKPDADTETKPAEGEEADEAEEVEETAEEKAERLKNETPEEKADRLKKEQESKDSLKSDTHHVVDETPEEKAERLKKEAESKDSLKSDTKHVTSS